MTKIINGLLQSCAMYVWMLAVERVTCQF